MRVGAVVTDLMLFSRIESACAAARASLDRADAPNELSGTYDLVLVDWSARGSDWVDALRRLDAARLILFGPHVDLGAHAAAKEAGLGPMMARSVVLAKLGALLDNRARP